MYKSFKLGFVLSDTGGTRDVLPLLKKLFAQGYFEIIVFASDFAKSILAQESITYVNVEGFDNKRIKDTIVKENINVIVTDNSVKLSPENYFIFQAKRLGIKTLTIIGFWANYLSKFNGICFNDIYKYLPDYLIVPNELAKEALLENSILADKVLVYGNPWFDELSSSRTDRLDTGRIIESEEALFISQPLSEFYGESADNPLFFGYTEYKVLDDILYSLERVQKDLKIKIKLTVRLHPRENVKKYNLNQKNILVEFDTQTDAVELIKKSDFLIGMNSTMLFEAGLLGKKVISYQPNLTGENFLMAKGYGLIDEVFSESELYSAIKNFIENQEVITREKHDKLLKILNVDGKSVDRIIKLLNKLAMV